ncbi:hypothetical protein BC833DRAFT_614903 [Globomyces pollinis-pini]|nr:hypothetical protein BC833DRAFT_614903 [Globomyces pollinis-pini]
MSNSNLNTSINPNDYCHICKEPLSESHISTDAHVFHNNCFKCYHCLQPFQENVYFFVNNGYYCEQDNSLLHDSRCGKCGDVIQGKCISAMNEKWHLEHFTCENCGKSLIGTNFVRKDDKPYCKTCPTLKEVEKLKLIEEASEKCEQCKKPITTQPLIFKNHKYHPIHFNCVRCEKVLDSKAREYQGDLYCFQDYEKMLSQICQMCRQPIIGLAVSALGKVYHPDHFVCFKCNLPFNGENHFEYEKKPYCELHYKEVTNQLCWYCHRPAKGNVISAMNSQWCDHHFNCMGCFTNLLEGGKPKYLDYDGKPFCKRCFDKLSFEIRKSITKYRDKDKEYR